MWRKAQEFGGVGPLGIFPRLQREVKEAQGCVVGRVTDPEEACVFLYRGEAVGICRAWWGEGIVEPL